MPTRESAGAPQTRETAAAPGSAGAPPAPKTTANRRPAHVSTSSAPLRRWKCLCAYDGAPFSGWQSQAGGMAIQDVIEARLAAVLGVETRIHASGRTDAGVHALGQVFHFDAAWRHGADKLKAALRSGLPTALQIQSVRPVSSEFHSRFSATGKIYAYHLYLGDADPFSRPYAWAIEKPLDVAAMKAATAALRGRHDFRAFSALNGPEKEDTVRDLRRLDFVQRGPRVRIEAEADGFMYKMVRSLVGAIYAAGEGKLTPAGIAELLATGKRTPVVQTAPPHGLFLVKVLYR
ncbi:tRNA pseudouridine(38-40) synthase TruA [Opitutaceae bacterium EW11]|nr:tRNA pseudouridine(38-40) synthase TruA [Opitutaceae bacterium EW11]